MWRTEVAVHHRKNPVAHHGRCATEFLHFLWRMFSPCATELGLSLAHSCPCAKKKYVDPTTNGWIASYATFSVAHGAGCAIEI